LQVGKINTDEQQELAVRFGIRSIPTLVLFRNGKEVARRSGTSDFGSLANWIDASLASTGT
jgi:thioredoxin 2